MEEGFRRDQGTIQDNDATFYINVTTTSNTFVPNHHPKSRNGVQDRNVSITVPIAKRLSFYLSPFPCFFKDGAVRHWLLYFTEK